MAVVAAHLNYPQYSKTQAFCQYDCVIKWAKWCGNCGKLRTIISVIMLRRQTSIFQNMLPFGRPVRANIAA